MKAETSRQIPQKLAAKLEFVLLSLVGGCNHCYHCFPQTLKELTNCPNNKAVFNTSETEPLLRCALPIYCLFVPKQEYL